VSAITDQDEVFEWIVECERLLDDVIEKLADAGLVLEPWQRVVVVRWLDMFSVGSPVPLSCRLATLRGMLSA
jgi:hypothetical protein